MTGTEKLDVSQIDIGRLGMGKGYELKRLAASSLDLGELGRGKSAFPAAQFLDPIDALRKTEPEVVAFPTSPGVSLNPFSEGGK